MQKQHSFDYTVFASAKELPSGLAPLLLAVTEARLHSYSPYSKFKVGAAALLEDGTIITGSNLENAAYPLGSCAERTLFDHVAHQGKLESVTHVAVIGSYDESGCEPCFPCGGCRQLLLQMEMRAKRTIKLLACTHKGPIILLPQIKLLLPFNFSGDNL